MNKIFIIIIVLVLVALGVGEIVLWQKVVQTNLSLLELKKNLQTNTVNKSNNIISSFFNCQNQKTIQAIFFEDKAELILSDNRNMLLLKAMSGSGARYTNTNESFVFWNKGDTAFIQEESIETFKDCIVSK
jgi:membrane-bound inhibitor of C-type lysozyme